VNCPKCATQLADGARFCPACGTAMSPTETQATSGGPAPGNIIGRELAGRYRIVAKLGEGGMGAVYRGEQISLKRAVAVKVLKPELSANPMLLRRFNAEAEVVAKLGHPNTVNIYDFGQDTDGSLYIAMEFIEGRSLRTVIQHEAPLPPARAFAIAVQVAASLADAHAHGIVHRDLKPDNVMMQARGRQRDVVRVLDFGIAKLRDDSRATQQAMTQAGDMLGTPQYMAPEQIKGETIDGRTDVYALGCMLYEMITARMPFEATSVMAMLSKHLIEEVVAPSVRRPDLAIAPAIDQIILWAVAKNPDQRPATMEQYGEHLAALLATLPPDPNRPASSALSAVQGVPSPPPATPAPYAPTPGTPAPPSYAPPPASYAAPGMPIAPTPLAGQMSAPPPATRSRGWLYAVIAIVVLGGGGVGAYFATRDGSTAATPGAGSQREPDPPPVHHDDPGPTKHTPVDVDDPWASKDTPTTATDEIGTAETPIPPGARLALDSSFVAMPDPSGKSIAYQLPNTGVVVAMAPLFAGTNDLDALAELWIKSLPIQMKHTKTRKLFSVGAQRDAVYFKGTTSGVSFEQVIVVYLSPSYRLGVLIQAPTTMFESAKFQQGITDLLTNRVILP
jgi:serine/threonine-protein kinase